jgi:hypothetical protein
MISISISPAIIALFPSFLELFKHILDGIGFLGEKMIRREIRADHRPVIQSTFVTAANGPAILAAITTYFRFNDRANEIIRLHLAFILSMYIDAAERNRDWLKIDGWNVLALLIVIVSLVLFFVLALRGSSSSFSPTSVRPFRGWTTWSWIMFVLIVGAEAAERLHKV